MHRKTKLIKQTLFNDCPNIGTCPKRESCSTLARPSVACFVYLLWLLRKEAAGSEKKRTVLCLLFPPQKNLGRKSDKARRMLRLRVEVGTFWCGGCSQAATNELKGR